MNSLNNIYPFLLLTLTGKIKPEQNPNNERCNVTLKSYTKTECAWTFDIVLLKSRCLNVYVHIQYTTLLPACQTHV